MKQYFKLFLVLLLLTLSQELSAKIWTVDNTPGSGADSTSLQGMINKASAGDTIIVMPSNTSYGGISFNKKLFIYSRSHNNNNLDKDRVVLLTFLTLSSSSPNAAFSEIKGIFVNGSISISTDNVRISNCKFNAISIYGSNNLIDGCIIDPQQLQNSTLFFGGSSHSNNIIKNCYISNINSSFNNYSSNFAIISGGNSSNLIANCFIFERKRSNITDTFGFRFFDNSYVKVYNSILWSNLTQRTNSFEFGSLGCTFKNNITYSNGGNVDTLFGSNNINNTMPIFEGGYNNTNNQPLYDTKANFKLSSSSVGKNKGTDSTDIGLYGGNYNFSIIGEVPGVIIFDDFEILNPIIKKGGTLKVKVNARKPE